MIRLSNLYSFGYTREFIDVKPQVSVVGPYLTDPSFFVPSIEDSKVQSTYDQFNGAYDDYKVPTALVDLRRPGNDISESQELLSVLESDFKDKIEVTKSELSDKFNKENDSKQTELNRDTFIDNLMNNFNSSNSST